MISTENNELASLQNEQLKLKQQQEALKQKEEEEIKVKLAMQQEKEIMLQKETLILSFKNSIAKNIKIYNETLNTTGCQYNAIKPTKSFEEEYNSIKDIKSHYMTYLKTLASNYIEQLNQCKL